VDGGWWGGLGRDSWQFSVIRMECSVLRAQFAELGE
jgi:hypothetical protein